LLLLISGIQMVQNSQVDWKTGFVVHSVWVYSS
jgi:hypothetical protein